MPVDIRPLLGRAIFSTRFLHCRPYQGSAQTRNREAEFVDLYSRFEAPCEEEGGADLGAHVNVAERKAYCFTKGPNAEAIRRVHEKLGFAFDSITEVRRVTGVDLRPEFPKAK